MRKASVRPDGTIELHESYELTEAEEKTLLRLSDAKAKTTVKPKQNLTAKAKEPRKEFEIPPSWEFIVEKETQSKRGTQSKYALYRDQINGSIIGLVKPSNAQTRMGDPDDPTSIIAQIMKAVNSMPLHGEFTRRELREVLPPKFYRGDYLKCALDYMEHLGMIKTKEKDIETGAIQYERQESNSNNVAAQQSDAKLKKIEFRRLDRL